MSRKKWGWFSALQGWGLVALFHGRQILNNDATALDGLGLTLAALIVGCCIGVLVIPNKETEQ